MSIKSFFPIFDSTKGHDAAAWRGDIMAGITVAVMLVPQGMAYALLAGLPPIYGLYGGVVPLLLYALMGTSRQMSIGPVAISALLVLAGVSQIAEPMTPAYIRLVIITGLLVGVCQLVLGVLQLGFLVNFISHPVIIGFTSAAAIIIAVSQLKDLLGIAIPRFSHLFETVTYAAQHLEATNWWSVFLCVGSMVLMMVLKKIKPSFPGALLAVLVGSLLVYFFKDAGLVVATAGEVPQGLPTFDPINISMEELQILWPTIFTVTIICIVESIAIAKILQRKHRDYKVIPNQELIALGISKIGGAFFQALPTSGSFSRSAVNNEAGAKSGIASLVAALLVALTLLFLTPFFYYLPKAVLAAIILLSIKGLFEWEEAKYLWRTNRNDFLMMAITFLVTLIIGIEAGVMVGVLLSIAAILYNSSRPHMAVLGKLPNTNSYRNVNRFADSEQVPGVLIIRFDEQLFFANADYFQTQMEDLIAINAEGLQAVLLDASNIHNVDSTGVQALEALHESLQKRQVNLIIAGMVGPVRDVLSKTGFIRGIGKSHVFLNVNQAVCFLQKEQDARWHPHAIQTNIGDEREGDVAED